MTPIILKSFRKIFIIILNVLYVSLRMLLWTKLVLLFKTEKI